MHPVRTNAKTLFAFDRYDKSGGLLLLLLEAAFPLLLVKWIRGRVVETQCSKIYFLFPFTDIFGLHSYPWVKSELMLALPPKITHFNTQSIQAGCTKFFKPFDLFLTFWRNAPNKFSDKFRHLNRIVPLCKAHWVAVAMTLIFSSYWIEAILKIKSIQFQTKRNWRMLSLASYFKTSEAVALWQCWHSYSYKRIFIFMT